MTIDWLGIAAAIIQQAPSVILIVVGLVIVFFSSVEKFRGHVMDDRTKKIGSFVGWPLVIIGVIPIIIMSGLSFWDNLGPLRQSGLTAFTAEVVRFLSPQFFLCVGLIGLGVILLHRAYFHFADKRDYKVECYPIDLGDNIFAIAVVNVGNKMVNCCARLVRVDAQKTPRSVSAALAVASINPDSLFLGWLPTTASIFPIHKDEAGLLPLVRVSPFDYERVIFSFANGERSPETWGYGYYTFTIDVLRKDRKGKWVKFAEAKETLKATQFQSKWITKKPEKKVSKNDKTKQPPKKQAS